MDRRNTLLPPQQAGQFETDQSAHAVTEQSKRPVQQRLNSFCNGANRQRNALKWRLTQTRSATGQLHRTNVNRRGKLGRPAAVNQRSTTSIRKAKQTQPRSLTYPGVGQPGSGFEGRVHSILNELS